MDNTVMQKLEIFQERKANEYGQKVDVYCNEETRIIGVFPHNSAPFPFNALEIINF
jgi:hypothetical protein